MHSIIDSPFNLGGVAQRLRQEGVRTVIRYYNNRNSSVFPSKCLTEQEKDQLFAAGLNVAVVFQQRGGAGGFLDDFSLQNARRDAARAVALARLLDQPEGSAIYFGVDHDFFRSAELAAITSYFRIVRSTLGSAFKVGVYGSGAVCSRLKSEGLTDFSWLPASMGWSGSRDFLKSLEWTLFQKFQNLTSDFGGFGYDGNVLNPAVTDFGQFGPATMPAIKSRSDADSIAVFKVSARSGLRLRSGPGEQFDKLRTLEKDSIVHGLGQLTNWVKVDVNGDGVADGFMSRDFLEPLSGGLPLPLPAAGITPFGVAQAELSLNVTEAPGSANNPRIVLYHESTSATAGTADAVAWCSSFVNYCVERAGHKGTNSQWARSWHESGWGEDVTGSPQPGDIVVWRRQTGDLDQGHVAFYVDAAGDNGIRVLGGNQSNSVRISVYPRSGMLDGSKYTLLSIRR